MVVGPLHPCFFIAVHDPVDGKSIVFHKSEVNCNNNIIKLIETQLKDQNREKFIFHMFSKEHDHDEKQTPESEIRQKKAIRQIENFKETFKALCVAFKPSKDRFKARFYKMKTSLGSVEFSKI